MSMAGHYTPRAIMAPIVGQMYKKLAGN